MNGIDSNFIQMVKDRADIVDIIGAHTQIKNAGRNQLALCPFHNEKSPSFNINPDSQFFHCFGCGVSGDVISFVRQFENLEFIDAVKYLADRYSIPIPEYRSGINPQNKSEKDELLRLHADVCEWFKNNLKLPSSQSIRDYVSNRGMTDADVSTFQVGYAPDSWTSLMDWAVAKGYKLDLLLKAGLVVFKEESNRYYDRFRNRLMFSIWNDEGKVIAFSGRVLNPDDKGAKYVNSPESMIFNKSAVLYGLSHARRHFRDLGAAILCEGQIDVIACHRAGLKNAVSTQGTSFTELHARKLSRNSDNVVIAFDSDTAGQKAAFKSLDTLLPIGINPKVLNWGEGMDPDLLYNNGGGADALQSCVKNARDLIEVFMEYLCTVYDSSTPDGKGKVAHELIKRIALIPDSITRSNYCQMVAYKLNLHPDSMFNELKTFMHNQKNNESPYAKKSKANYVVPEAEQETSHGAFTASQQIELSLLSLAVTFEDIAMDIAENILPKLLTKSITGVALGEILDLTLMGDWLMCKEVLLEKYCSQDRRLTDRLAMPELSVGREHNCVRLNAGDLMIRLEEPVLRARKAVLMKALRVPEGDIKAQIREVIEINKALVNLPSKYRDLI